MTHTEQPHTLLPQSPYKKRHLKPYHIKYYGMVAVLFMMFWAIQVFVNYATMQTSITDVMQEKDEIHRHTAYLALQTVIYSLPESAIFVAHDNGMLLPGERIMMAMPHTLQGTGQTITGDMTVLNGMQGVGGGVSSTGAKSITPALSSGAVEEKRKKEALPSRQSWVLYIGEKMNHEEKK